MKYLLEIIEKKEDRLEISVGCCYLNSPGSFDHTLRFKSKKDFDWFYNNYKNSEETYITGKFYYYDYFKKPFRVKREYVKYETKTYIYNSLKIFCQYDKEKQMYHIEGKAPEEYAKLYIEKDCIKAYPTPTEQLKTKHIPYYINLSAISFKQVSNTEKNKNIQTIKELRVNYEKPKQFDSVPTNQYVITKFPPYNSIVYLHRYDGKARSGYKDKNFKEEIEKYIKEPEIKIIENASLHLEEGKLPYEPDIAIIIKETSIRIDIEIDEPYAADSSRKPIHYLESEDEKRDTIFNNNGWIVIRFTEKQVHEQCKNCIAFIAHLISEITGGKYLIPTELKNIDNPHSENRWTRSEAESFAKEKYRENYLNINDFGNQPTDSFTKEELELTSDEQSIAEQQKESINSSSENYQNKDNNIPKLNELLKLIDKPINNLRKPIPYSSIIIKENKQSSFWNWIKDFINKLFLL